jgi:Tol biopolymer transport system component
MRACSILTQENQIVGENNPGYQVNCDSQKSNGHIYFLRQHAGKDRYPTSGYDLLVMNGNGCFPRFILGNVSGSPAISKDGQQLAIGCQNNRYLCIVALEPTLGTCTGSENELGECTSVILEKYALPGEIAGNNRLYNISWSFDGHQIVIDGKNTESNNVYMEILDLSNSGQWSKLLERNFPFKVDWSPNGEIAFSGVYTIESNGQNMKKIISGGDPSWSFDGTKLAYLTTYEDTLRQSLVSLNIENQESLVLWVEVAPDQSDQTTRTLLIRDGGSDQRLLSWSTDEKHIAFVGIYQNMFDSQIYRLNTATGQIVPLTAKFHFTEGDNYFSAPGWGP